MPNLNKGTSLRGLSMGDEGDVQNLRTFIEESGGLELAAKRLRVWPSTLHKILAGRSISVPTALKLDTLFGKHPAKKQLVSNQFEAVISTIRETVKTQVDILQTSLKFNVNPSTIRKILEGKPVSHGVQQKLFAVIGRSSLEIAEPTPVVRSSMVERLNYVHQLYESLGTLEAAGKVIGVTRERIRQLLVKGSRLGLFDYKPFEYPFIAREALVADYRKHLSLGRVAKTNGITASYLRKLLTAYRITEGQLRSLREEGQKLQCIKAYNTITEQLGYHPTTTILQAKKSWRYLSMKITRLWGSIDTFRQELSIPAPLKGSRSFREDTRKWRETRQRLALIIRMQHLDRVRECLNASGLLSSNEIAYECGLRFQRTLFLLKLLMATGEVNRVGQGASVRYRLARNRSQ